VVAYLQAGINGGGATYFYKCDARHKSSTLLIILVICFWCPNHQWNSLNL